MFSVLDNSVVASNAFRQSALDLGATNAQVDLVLATLTMPTVLGYDPSDDQIIERLYLIAGEAGVDPIYTSAVIDGVRRAIQSQMALEAEIDSLIASLEREVARQEAEAEAEATAAWLAFVSAPRPRRTLREWFEDAKDSLLDRIGAV